MYKTLNTKQAVLIDRQMYENLTDSLSDLTSSVRKHPFGSKLNYYCYLLAMMRATIDFSTVAEHGNNPSLIFQLDTLYQKLQKMLIKARSHWAFLNLKAPLQKRESIGTIHSNLMLIKKLIDDGDESVQKAKVSGKSSEKDADKHGQNN